MRAQVVALLLLTGCNTQSSEPIIVFAAASLTDGLAAISTEFEKSNPAYRVDVSVGPTSLLARQIHFGAPADVFMAADPAWTDYLEENGHVLDATRVFLSNRLVVVGKSGATPLTSLGALEEAGKIAMADPAHVPAGVYARTSLECAGLWDALDKQVIPTLDVRAAAVAVLSGAAELAIIYTSDIGLAPELDVVLEWPQACAPDIKYAASVIDRGGNRAGAQAFVTFAASGATDSLWQQFGFSRQLE